MFYMVIEILLLRINTEWQIELSEETPVKLCAYAIAWLWS